MLFCASDRNTSQEVLGGQRKIRGEYIKNDLEIKGFFIDKIHNRTL